MIIAIGNDIELIRFISMMKLNDLRYKNLFSLGCHGPLRDKYFASLYFRHGATVTAKPKNILIYDEAAQNYFAI
jgi:hypothetical protein